MRHEEAFGRKATVWEDLGIGVAVFAFAAAMVIGIGLWTHYVTGAFLILSVAILAWHSGFRPAFVASVLSTLAIGPLTSALDANVSYGSGNRWISDIFVSGGTEAVSGSISAYRLSSDGFYENLATNNDEVDDEDEWGARGKLLFAVGESSEFEVTVDGFKNTGTYGKFFSQIGENNVLASIFPGACYTGKQHKGCSDMEALTSDSIPFRNSSTRCDLPMPASPRTSAVCPAPPLASRHASARMVSSVVRPTSRVRCMARGRGRSPSTRYTEPMPGAPSSEATPRSS